MTQLPHSPTPQGSTRLVIVAVVLAVLAVILVNAYIAVVRTQARGGEFIVYRLKHSVEVGEKFSNNDVIPMRVPDRFKSSFPTAIDEQGLTTNLGGTFYRPADRYAVVTSDLFRDPTKEELDRKIADNRRGVALPVDSRGVPAGLRPGVYVDITAPFTGTGSLPRVLTIMERVQVLAVGDWSIVSDSTARHNRDARRGSFSTITIAVTPDQAAQLASIKALVTGNFQLELRNPGDEGQPQIPGGGINPLVLKMINVAATPASRSRRG